ncbi:MAG: glycosyltransferase family 2 protein, partial [Moraxellaceae bacterium]
MSSSPKESLPQKQSSDENHSTSLRLLPVSVIILTFNESKNIADCLESVKELTDDIILVDSGSTDDTIAIAARYSVSVYFHPFEDYSKQRNWAFQNADTKYPWILNMDADHRLTGELVQELRSIFLKGISDDVNGFMASRRTMFMGRWIK